MNLTQAVNNSLKAFRRDVPDCIGVGVVDISTGMLLAVDTADKHPAEILDMLAAATADLFQGKTVTQIEEAWKHIRGRPALLPGDPRQQRQSRPPVHAQQDQPGPGGGGDLQP
jgi:hypothetical protein